MSCSYALPRSGGQGRVQETVQSNWQLFQSHLESRRETPANQKMEKWGFFVVCLFLINKFIYGCVGSSFLCEGFLWLQQVGATLHRGARASHHRGLSLQSTGSRRAGSVVVAHGLSCSAACGIFPDQGSNPCPLHWQADSQPLRHQGSPGKVFLKDKTKARRVQGRLCPS